MKSSGLVFFNQKTLGECKALNSFSSGVGKQGPEEGLIVYVLGFAGYLVSAANTQLCYHRQYINELAWLCFNKI